MFQTSYKVAGTLIDVVVDTHRRKHIAYLMAEQGALVNPESSARNLPKQQVTKRQIRQSRSLLSSLVLGGSAGDADDDTGKAKNVRQTELIVDLREAILQLGRHFQAIDPENGKVVSWLR